MALGLIFGIIIELMIDAGTIRDLQAQNRKLRLELAQERKSPEVIEIIDRTVASDVDFSQKW